MNAEDVIGFRHSDICDAIYKDALVRGMTASTCTCIGGPPARVTPAGRAQVHAVERDKKNRDDARTKPTERPPAPDPSDMRRRISELYAMSDALRSNAMDLMRAVIAIEDQQSAKKDAPR